MQAAKVQRWLVQHQGHGKAFPAGELPAPLYPVSRRKAVVLVA